MAAHSRPVFRFAPSPNGWLHLGHAYSAILNHEAAARNGGRFLLRIEDIDGTRARPEFVAGIFEDLRWLGLTWEEPVRHQSQHMADYDAALRRLQGRGLVYPCFCSRADIARAVADDEGKTKAPWPRDPDGAPHYPGACRRSPAAKARSDAGEPCAFRLDMTAALAATGPLRWTERSETGAPSVIAADPAGWGDAIVARKDIATSYHLAVVADDALQGVTDVVRGRDLYHATSLHRLLQSLLGLPEPAYSHHRLILDESGDKLGKSVGSTALRRLRGEGCSPDDVRRMIFTPA